MTNEAPLTGESEDVKKVLVLTGEALDEPFARNMSAGRARKKRSRCRGFGWLESRLCESVLNSNLCLV